MPSDLSRSGTKASATSAILSIVIDSLVRKALELALAETREQSDFPTDGFAWLTLGSVARRGGDAVLRCRERRDMVRRISHAQ